MSLEIEPLFIKIFIILVEVTIVELVEDNIEPIGKDIKHVDTLTISSRVE